MDRSARENARFPQMRGAILLWVFGMAHNSRQGSGCRDATRTPPLQLHKVRSVLRRDGWVGAMGAVDLAAHHADLLLGDGVRDRTARLAARR